MGCDIHPHLEVRRDGSWHKFTSDVFPLGEYDDVTLWDKGVRHISIPFDWRSYGMFGFLAGVRNYSEVPVIAAPRGIPDDASPEVREDHGEWDCNAHSASWLTLRELQSFDYDQVFWDRRVMKWNGHFWDGAARADEGEGEHLTLRDFLGEKFFQHITIMGNLGYEPDDVRVVFWFDN